VAIVRIVAMADTHGCHSQLQVPDGDVLIHAGDLTPMGRPAQLAAVAEWMRSLPHRHKIVIAGNHDFALQRDPAGSRSLFHGLTYLEDQEYLADGLRIWGSPWQPEFFDWAFNLPRGEAIDAKWQLIPERLDVLITHGPPLGYGDRVHRGERVGCRDLLRHCLAKTPRLHLFGHIHEDPGQWDAGGVRFVNVTTSDADLPVTVIDLPLLR
jgi:predicted phosphodiesterase